MHFHRNFNLQWQKLPIYYKKSHVDLQKSNKKIFGQTNEWSGMNEL